jgi:peptide deformylase
MIIVDQKKLKIVSNEVPFEESQQVIDLLLKEIPETGSGLAAIQIGLPVRIFLTRFKKNKSEWANPYVEEYELIQWINPKIEEYEKEEIISEEGCLSIPDRRVKVKRNKQITVSTQASTIDRKKFVLLDEEAVIFQHEFDHLNGILITDKIYKPAEKVGRNDPCPCGSGKKFKKCCGN